VFCGREVHGEFGVLSWWITNECGIRDPEQGRKVWIKYLKVRRRTEFKVRLLF